VQAAGGEQNRGVDPVLLAALRETVTAAVSTSVQAETTLLAAQLGSVTARLGVLEGAAQRFQAVQDRLLDTEDDIFQYSQFLSRVFDFLAGV
jgi:hypothetical protein